MGEALTYLLAIIGVVVTAVWATNKMGSNPRPKPATKEDVRKLSEALDEQLAALNRLKQKLGIEN